jgi:phosphate transport system substrate-binding protein
MEKLALAVAEDFMNKNDDVTINAEFVGSSAGIEAVTNGTADIGNASRGLKEEEKANGVVENIVAIDGIAVIINKNNTVTNVTKDQLIGIYTGTITNWSELSGKDSPIVVIGRESGSGTRGAFEEILKIEDACTYANELDNTGAVMAQVAATEGAVGYVSLDVVNDTVTAVGFDSVAANADNVKSGSYTLSRPFVMATKGEISEQSELIKAFFNYLTSEEGKAIIAKVGLVTVD